MYIDVPVYDYNFRVMNILEARVILLSARLNCIYRKS